MTASSHRPAHRAVARVRAGLPQLRRRPTRSARSTPASSACGPLEIGYDAAALARVTHDEIEAGPHSLWRYAGLLPVGQDPATRVDSGTGMTPLIRADRLADELGFTAPLWIKDDSANPTHSFKDRVVSVAITAARELGFDRIACASTGNLANSVAAHAARIGMPSIVFVPADLEPAKIIQTAVYGGTLVGIEGSYDDVNRLCSRARRRPTSSRTPASSTSTSARTTPRARRRSGYEVAEQLGWRLPGQYVAPMASGSMLTKIHKAFKELVAAGLVPDVVVAGVRRAVGRLLADRDGVRVGRRRRSCR